jgi:hypothetical protein
MDVKWSLDYMRRKLVTARRGLRKADEISKMDRELATSNTREITRLLDELEGMLS